MHGSQTHWKAPTWFLGFGLGERSGWRESRKNIGCEWPTSNYRRDEQVIEGARKWAKLIWREASQEEEKGKGKRKEKREGKRKRKRKTDGMQVPTMWSLLLFLRSLAGNS